MTALMTHGNDPQLFLKMKDVCEVREVLDNYGKYYLTMKLVLEGIEITAFTDHYESKLLDQGAA